MKKQFTITRILAFCMILIITFVLAQLSNAVTAPAPGSGEDPLITKSYVDGKVKTLSAKITTLTSAVDSAEAALSVANASIIALKEQIASLIASKPEVGKYQVVKKGKTIVLKVGGQMVIYTGTALVVGKLTDLTDGKALIANQVVKLRHLIVSAVSDTRGVKASTDINVLLSGNYTVK